MFRIARRTAIFLTVSLAIVCVSLFDSNSSKADVPLTFDNLDPISTSLVAYKNVNDYIDSLPTATSKPILYVSPSIGQRDYSLSLTGMNRVATLWTEFVSPEKLNIVIFDGQDLNWADEKQIELTAGWLQNGELPSKRYAKYGCNTAGMYLPGMFIFCLKDYVIPLNTTEYYAEAHKFAHEYTHFMEMNYKNWMAHARGQGIGTRNPCWIEEGFATFYGFAVGSNPLEPTGKLRRQFTSDLLRNYDLKRNDSVGTLKNLIQKGNVSEMKKLFSMLENTPWPCDETENAYALGSMAAEALVAVKGQKGMMDFYKASARTGNWKASFEEAFGLSVDSFYEKLTPYIASQYTESNFVYTTPAPIQSPTPTPTPTPSTSSPVTSIKSSPTKSASPITKKTTITCIKGKVIKKVTAEKPKCPSGYKKK